MPFPLNAGNAAAYLARRGLITPAAAAADTTTATTLGGGVSNIVVCVAGAGVPGGAVVVKQSLPQLRVAQEWRADRSRIHREWASIRYLAGILPPDAIPQVIDWDDDNFIYVMTAAPPDGVNWKEALLAGNINAAVAGKVGRLLGRMHQATALTDGDIPDALRPFADQRSFVQLRIDPYHRATAAAHPDLADAITAAADQMLGQPLAMVHGDYSPKNVIISGAARDAADKSDAADSADNSDDADDANNAAVMLLDFEVVHLGHPAFDLAFMLNHLTLKALHRPEWAAQYNRAAAAFWSEYAAMANTPPDLAATLERDTIRQLGVLLLARMDGKSPVEYITADAAKARVRRLARAILSGDLPRLPDIHQTLITVIPHPYYRHSGASRNPGAPEPATPPDR